MKEIYSASDRRNDAQKEYYHILDRINNNETKLLTIKTWSVTVSTTAIAASFVESKPSISLLAVLCSIVFWYLDAVWKYFQMIPRKRMSEIENIFESNNWDIYNGPEVSKYFNKELSKTKYFPKSLNQLNVILPHAVFIIIGIASYIIQQ